jgi:putative sugar O-methyltransferase
MMIKKYAKILIKHILFKKMSEIRFNKPTEAESNLIQELRNEVQVLEFHEDEKMSASATMWHRNVKQLQALILKQDPREFLTWKVVKRTMFVETPLYILREYRYLKRKRDFKALWSDYIKESDIGAPSTYYALGKSSGNLVHHAYHIAIFQDRTQQWIPETDLILEFGGGYGSMCRLIHQMHFKKQYIIFDLPMFSALQKYYLKSLGLPVLTIDAFLKNDSGILCISSLEELEAILKQLNVSTINATFMATWSLSETPLNLRNKITTLISEFNNFLIAYQLRFGEVDNTPFFNTFSSDQQHIQWEDWQIPHMKGSRYLIGYGK